MSGWIVLIVVIAGLIVLAGGILVILAIGQMLARPTSGRLPTGNTALAAGETVCPVAESAPPASVPLGCLVAVSGALAGRTFTLEPPPRGLLIGRSADNDIVVDAPMVSRRHAQVMIEGNEVVLYDRDSTNGTWLVDGRRVSRHVLSIGDRFQIGDVVFVYAWPDQPLPPPPRPSQPLPALEVQTRFEGYLLLNVLGHGGMSVVYRAQAPDGACVALKILDATDEWVARKFVQEGSLGAALRDHPHIRMVYALRYSQDRRPYLVMEYVEGTSLRRMLGTRLPLTQVVSIVGQVCEALEYAHQHGVVHRDIKPENILVTPQGLVKVTDFGIAKITSAVTVTSDRIVGTPEYISPEQAKGEMVGPASDIYSLGVVLYELLTGQVPFPLPPRSDELDQRSAAYAVIRQHIHAAPAPPGHLNPDVASSPIERVTLKALEKEPRKRYKCALEMAEALGYRPQQPVPVAQPATGEARLIMLDGPQAGRVIPVTGDQFVVGRALLDPQQLQISRRHAVLLQKGQGWWLQDTSMNGTWVNGQRIYGEVPLDAGSVIEIGGYKLKVQF